MILLKISDFTFHLSDLGFLFSFDLQKQFLADKFEIVQGPWVG